MDDWIYHPLQRAAQQAIQSRTDGGFRLCVWERHEHPLVSAYRQREDSCHGACNPSAAEPLCGRLWSGSSRHGCRRWPQSAEGGREPGLPAPRRLPEDDLPRPHQRLCWEQSVSPRISVGSSRGVVSGETGGLRRGEGPRNYQEMR